MDRGGKSATLPAGLHNKPQPKLSSHSFSGGFLGRLKRRFRLKSKGYEFQHAPSSSVQGVRIQWTPERDIKPRAAERVVSEGGRIGVVPDHETERSSEFINPTYSVDMKPVRYGKRKGPSSKSAAAMCNQIEQEIHQLNGGDGIVRNDYLVSEDSVIDLEDDVGCSKEDVFDDVDPGYETLDEIRRKMHIRTTQEQQENSSNTAGLESVYYRPKVQQHRRSQSSGQPTSVTSYHGEVNAMRDSGLGSPLVSDASSSLRTSDMMRESMSIVSDTDVSSLGFQHLSHSDYAEADSFLSPTSNLGAMKMNSCPGNTTNNFDTTPVGSQDFVSYHGVCNSDTYLAQCQQTLFDDDGMELYANPKILLRKKTQRENNNGNNGAIINLATNGSDQTLHDHVPQTNGSSKETCTESVEITDVTEAPPIPERKYSLYLDKKTCDITNSHINDLDKVNGCHGDLYRVSKEDDNVLNVLTADDNKNVIILNEDSINDQIDGKPSESGETIHSNRNDSWQDLHFQETESENVHKVIDEPINHSQNYLISSENVEPQNKSANFIEKDDNVIEISSQKDDVDIESVDIKCHEMAVSVCSCDLKDPSIQNSMTDNKKSQPSQSLNYTSTADILDVNCCTESANESSHSGQTDCSNTSAKVTGKSADDRVILSGDVRSLSQTEDFDEAGGMENDSETEIFPFGPPLVVLREKDASDLPPELCSKSFDKNNDLHRDFTEESEQLKDTDTDNEILRSSGYKLTVVKNERISSNSEEGDTQVASNVSGMTFKLENGGPKVLQDFEEGVESVGSYKLQDSSTECSCDSTATDSTLKGLSGCSSDLSPLDNVGEAGDLSPFGSLAESNNLSAENASEPTSESTPNIELSPLDNCSTELSPIGTGDSNEFSPLVQDNVELSPFGSVVGSAGSSSDRLSEPLSNIQVMSYEDSADAVLESMYSRSDSFADECDRSLSPASGNAVSSPQTRKPISNKGTRKSSDSDQTQATTPSSGDGSESSSGATTSFTSRLPDYYYQDTEPVHMSLSELGIPETWPANKEEVTTVLESDKQDSEPTHMSWDELNTARDGSKNFYHVSTYHDDLPSTSRPLQTRSLPPSHPTFNVYERVDNDPGSGDSLELYQEGYNSIPWQNQDSNSSFRHSWSPLVPADDNRVVRDEAFLRRLDERPPALVPKRNHEGDIHQDFMESMRQLKDCGWYWGPLSWDEAEIKLINKPDGSFLVRDSSDDRYILSLSFNMQGRVHHTRIEHHKGKFSFWSQPDSHGKSTIREFIEQCVRNSRNGQFLYFIRPSGPGSPPMPVHLLYPVSRYRQMRSLQHMCRFRILQVVRRDHIDRLPIPTRIKDYLKDPQYYVEYLEDD